MSTVFGIAYEFEEEEHPAKASDSDTALLCNCMICLISRWHYTQKNSQNGQDEIKTP